MRQIPVDTDVTSLVARALIPYNLKPPNEEIEALLSALTRHGEYLLADVVRLGRRTSRSPRCRTGTPCPAAAPRTRPWAPGTTPAHWPGSSGPFVARSTRWVQRMDAEDVTTPRSYPTGRWTGPPPKCPGCGAQPLPIGGPEGGVTVHEPGCPRAGLVTWSAQR